MTTIYFVREAQYDTSKGEDKERKLTSEGKHRCLPIHEFLKDKRVDYVYSSPYVRAIETIKPFSDGIKKPIYVVDEFAERKVGGLCADVNSYELRQWLNHNYRLPGGESLYDVQERMIDGLQMIVNEHQNQTIVVSTHGTALSTVINYFDPSFSYEEYQQIKNDMPWMVKFTFDGEVCTDIEDIIIR